MSDSKEHGLNDQGEAFADLPQEAIPLYDTESGPESEGGVDPSTSSMTSSDGIVEAWGESQAELAPQELLSQQPHLQSDLGEDVATSMALNDGVESDFLTAESAEPRLNMGPQFSLSSMFILVAISALLIAASQWIGFLPAFLIATGISFLALTCVLLTALLMRIGSEDSIDHKPMMVRLERMNIALTLLTAVLLVTSLFGGGAVGARAILKQRAQMAVLEKDFGFRHRTIALFNKDENVQYLEVVSVTPGGEFERAGIREGDVIPFNRKRFIDDVNENRGQSMGITVGAGGGLSGDWEDFTTRSVTLEVPE